MKILIIILSLFLATSVFAETKLYHYTDKLTGDEKGVCYSGRDGTPAITNPDWNMEEIAEKDKEHYIKLQEKQLKQKQQDAENILNQKKNKAKLKLKTLGLTDEEIEGIIR